MTIRITMLFTGIGLAIATPALPDTRANTPQAAHVAYLAAINSNKLDQFLETVTDDVVFIAPGAPVMEGKAKVGPWVRGYFDAVHTRWKKQSVEFVVAASWAFERYEFTAADVPREPGPATVSTGHGINIYHLEDDGTWRVARDIWSNANTFSAGRSIAPACSGRAEPC